MVAEAIADVIQTHRMCQIHVYHDEYVAGGTAESGLYFMLFGKIFTDLLILSGIQLVI